MNIHFSDFLIFTGNKSQSQEHGQSENQLFQTKCIFEQFFSCISVSFAVHSLLKHAALTQFALPIITQLQCSFLTLSELFTMNIFHIFFFQKITARLEILAVQTSEGPHVVCRWFFLQKFIVSTTRVEIGWKVGLRPCEAISFLVVWCFQTTAGFLCGLQKFCTKPLGFCKLE